jgi:hypothetical protein
VPETIDRVRAAFAQSYAVEREVGQGGMATVYLAQDLKHHRKVALKVLRPELAAAMGGDRFPREIQIIAQLSHPHILPLHDSGEMGGFLFYVMPFVEGESLREKLGHAATPHEATENVYEFLPVWSPDGTRLAVVAQPIPLETMDLHLVTWPEGTWSTLTSTPDRAEIEAIWTPDGRQLIYTADRTSNRIMKVSVADLLTESATK